MKKKFAQPARIFTDDSIACWQFLIKVFPKDLSQPWGLMPLVLDNQFRLRDVGHCGRDRPTAVLSTCTNPRSLIVASRNIRDSINFCVTKKRHPREEGAVCPTVVSLKNQATLANVLRRANTPRAAIAVPNRTRVLPPSGTL